MLNLTQANFGHGSGDFSGDKSFSTSGTLMVEQDAIASKHAISFPKIHHAPEGKKLSHSIRGPKKTKITVTCLFTWVTKLAADTLQLTKKEPNLAAFG